MSPITFWLGNLTQLTNLDLGQNKLQGQILQSMFNLVNLTTLYLHSNDLNGLLKFESFLNLSHLIELQLSGNHLSLLTNITINVTVPKFRNLGLAFCNLPEFPDFLYEQDELEILELSGNKTHGQIPKWVWEMSKESLSYLGLSRNFLTGFDQPISPMTYLQILHLESNKLQGSIPIPSPSIFFYSVSNNSLTGEFSPLLCNLSSLAYLDLSNNNFSGMLPQCLANLSLLVLDLRNNNFVGSIPQLCMKGSKLRMIDFNQNQFQGQLPIISQLQHGNLSSQYFQNWMALKVVDAANMSYLQANSNLETQNYNCDNYFAYSVTIASKGRETDYDRILKFLVAIDISSNSFEGCIPENIGNLKALRLLNHSNNVLSCHIPPSLGNLSNLESLDFSHNKLSGEIPTELLQLTFLEFLNVSHNHLLGQIPQGNHFATFENNSFGSNPGLCGKPLSKTCNSFQVSPPPFSSEEDQGRESLLEFDWKTILMGYGSGLVIGLAIGHIYIPNKNEWFMKYLVRIQQKRRETLRGSRN
ncbi:hypothetical protein REPUB_Repub17cG0034500 [Reevesia pubescens]